MRQQRLLNLGQLRECFGTQVYRIRELVVAKARQIITVGAERLSLIHI